MTCSGCRSWSSSSHLAHQSMTAMLPCARGATQLSGALMMRGACTSATSSSRASSGLWVSWERSHVCSGLNLKNAWLFCVVQRTEYYTLGTPVS